jgi:hypothetical protein
VTVLQLFFDAGSGGILWPSAVEDWEHFGNPVDLDRLRISEELRSELARLVRQYDASLNWDYPPDPGPGREAECIMFNTAVRLAWSRLHEELGPGWTLVDRFTELHGVPDLVPGR